MGATEDRGAVQGGAAQGGGTHARTLGRLVKGKNIDESTLLATDYLNHFNEVIMLLGLIPDMPDCLADAKAWRPKTYDEHFRDSAFSDKELAILAYENAPARYREPFDRTVEQMNRIVARGIARIEAAIASGREEQVAESVATVSRQLQNLVDVASAIIHGAERALDQAEIDAMLGGEG